MIYDKNKMTIHPGLPETEAVARSQLSEPKPEQFQENYDELVTLNKGGTLPVRKE